MAIATTNNMATGNSKNNYNHYIVCK